jgi:hypothetical protein
MKLFSNFNLEIPINYRPGKEGFSENNSNERLEVLWPPKGTISSMKAGRLIYRSLNSAEQFSRGAIQGNEHNKNKQKL